LELAVYVEGGAVVHVGQGLHDSPGFLGLLPDLLGHVVLVFVTHPSRAELVLVDARDIGLEGCVERLHLSLRGLDRIGQPVQPDLVGPRGLCPPVQ